MIIAFVESIKYVGHFLPISFLRIFLGYYYFNLGISHLKSGYLEHAYMAEDIRNFLPQATVPEFMRFFLENIVIPNWQVFAHVFVIFQIVMGLAYILGYLVRPFAMLGMLACVLLLMVQTTTDLQTTFVLMVHLTLGWMGAGRCLGLDYYFYKRHRGIWW